MSGPAPLEELIRRYAAGETPDQIAATLGISGNAVRKRLIRAGVQMRGHVEAQEKYRKRPIKTPNALLDPVKPPPWDERLAKSKYVVLRIGTTPQGMEERRNPVGIFLAEHTAQEVAFSCNVSETSDDIFLVAKGRDAP